MRTLEENDDFFRNLMKLKTTFYWRGHELELKGDHIQVYTPEALIELEGNTSVAFYESVKLERESNN
jgi:hypothetical protein